MFDEGVHIMARMRITLVALLLSTSTAWSQTGGGENPHITSSKAMFDMVKGIVLKSAEKMPEDKFSFRPVEDVRTYGQLLGHIADAQFLICGFAKEGAGKPRGIEKSATTKADLVKGLNEGFAYCESVYAGMTDAGSAEMVKIFGQPRTKLGVLDFNIAHTMEHYGNLVTYMRINKIVPPSSERR